jgi:hypothetical protein
MPGDTTGGYRPTGGPDKAPQHIPSMRSSVQPPPDLTTIRNLQHQEIDRLEALTDRIESLSEQIAKLMEWLQKPPSNDLVDTLRNLPRAVADELERRHLVGRGS